MPTELVDDAAWCDSTVTCGRAMPSFGRAKRAVVAAHHKSTVTLSIAFTPPADNLTRAEIEAGRATATAESDARDLSDCTDRCQSDHPTQIER